jgi:hypothetical protein
MRRRTVPATLVAACLLFVGLSATASAAPPVATMTITLGGVKDHKVPILGRVVGKGTLKPVTPGELVDVSLIRNGNVIETKTVGAGDGTYRARFRIRKAGGYRLRATHAANAALGDGSVTSSRFGVKFPDLKLGNHGPKVRLFNSLLCKAHYICSSSDRYTATTGRGVMAYRKVNRLRRTFNSAGSDIFKKLSNGGGRYTLLHPDAGHHAEVSIRRQVLVLADGSQVVRVFHVSTGAPSTPTIKGHYSFFRREPGYNAKSMYYSIYWHNGYAIHGYHSVPAYPASHGCVRTPISDQKRIWNWINLGDDIFVY